MTRKEILTRAAESITSETHKYSCSAIMRKCTDIRRVRLAREYANYYGFYCYDRAPFGNGPKAQLARSLALLFYAETL